MHALLVSWSEVRVTIILGDGGTSEAPWGRNNVAPGVSHGIQALSPLVPIGVKTKLQTDDGAQRFGVSVN